MIGPSYNPFRTNDGFCRRDLCAYTCIYYIYIYFFFFFTKATPSCILVSGPGTSQNACGRAVFQVVIVEVIKVNE